jgi:hypothetical protein
MENRTSNLPKRPIQLQTPKADQRYFSSLPFDDERIHAASIYCSDGRFGEQMDEFLHNSLGLPRYDRVAVPGGAACMGGHLMMHHEAQALERQLSFLINCHGLTRIVMIAHDGCAFYKGLWLSEMSIEKQQAADMHRAAEQIRSHHPKIAVESWFARKVNGKIGFEKM